MSVELTGDKDDFTAGLAANDAIIGEKNFSVQFSPVGFGDFSSTVRITFCDGQTKELRLRGRKIDVSQFAPQSDNFSFSAVAVGGKISLKKNFTNTSQDSVTFDLASTPSNPFRIISPAFPIRLAPGQSVELTIEFAPIDTGAYTDSVLLSISEPCDYPATKFYLDGQSNTRIGSVRVTVPDFSAAPGENAKALLRLSSADESLFPEARISSAKIFLSYDKTLLVPRSVNTGAAANGFAASFIESSPGRAEIALQASSAILNSGVIAEVNFTALLGTSRETMVTIDSTSFVSPDFIINGSGEDGKFILTDNCSVGRRIDSETGNIILRLKRQASDLIALEFEIPVDGPVSLSVFDSFGKEIFSHREGFMRNGSYEAGIPLVNFSSGVFFIELKAPGIQTILPFSHIR